MNTPELVDAAISFIGGVAGLIFSARISAKRPKDGSQADRASAKRAKILGILGTLLLVFGLYRMGTAILTPQTSAQTQNLETSLSEQAARMNVGLPREIEPGLFIEKVIPGPRSLTYQARFATRSASDLDRQHIEAQQAQRVHISGCTNQDFVRALDAGTMLIYEYLDKDDKVVATVHVDSEFCKKKSSPSMQPTEKRGG